MSFLLTLRDRFYERDLCETQTTMCTAQNLAPKDFTHQGTKSYPVGRQAVKQAPVTMTTLDRQRRPIQWRVCTVNPWGNQNTLWVSTGNCSDRAGSGNVLPLFNLRESLKETHFYSEAEAPVSVCTAAVDSTSVWPVLNPGGVEGASENPCVSRPGRQKTFLGSYL